MHLRILQVSLLCAAAATFAGCTGGRNYGHYAISTGGDAQVGKRLMLEYDCGSCHTIPGLRDAHGVFGPPLTLMARRSLIAGQIPNTPENLTRWIMAPTSLKPRTTMPDMGLSLRDAQDIAAYVQTLN